MDMESRAEDKRIETRADAPFFTVDSFANGIAIGQQKFEGQGDPRDYFYLRLEDDAGMVRLRSRYALHTENPLQELERNLMRLSRQGVLGGSTIYLGVSTDPYLPFDGKFEASMKFLNLFQRYVPGMLVVQTRSPLIVIAMPVLRKLGRQVAVTLGVETNQEDAVQRYTPGFPRISERLKVADALRKFGIEVTLQVGPLLPYGDWRNDAPAFAELLAAHGDYVHVRPLVDGSRESEKRARPTQLAHKLAAERRFHWLRPDAANPLITALEKIAPEKLLPPVREHLKEKQLKMFAA